MKKLALKRNPLYKLLIAAAAFFSILVGGIIGYMIIEHYNFIDALYMTVITISTVGFEEVHKLSENGKWFTTILILINLSLLTYFVTQITQNLLDGNLQLLYKQYKMKKAINQLRDHVIICGYGRNGKAAAQLVMKSNIPIVVLERHESGESGEGDLHFHMTADATTDDALHEAGITNAKALITTLPEDADNLFIVLTAKELNPKLRIISRASNDSSIRKLKSAGASEVIMPDKIGGIHMASLVINPDVKTFIDYMSNQITDIQLGEIPVNKTIVLSEMDAWKKTGATVLGMRNVESNYILNPPADTTLHRGDRVIALGSQKQLKELEGLVN